MKKLHVSTTIALLLNCTAVMFLLANNPLGAASCALVAYFAAMKEVSKYTSWYQFTNVWAAAIVLGLSIDFTGNHLPIFAGIVFLAGFGAIFRIVNFKVFSYTGQSWFEPTVLIIAALATFIAAILMHCGWEAYAFPVPVLVFSVVLARGIQKDKKQLLSHTKGGYRVQVGAEATNFSLPDQNGEIVNLSDYKNKRHLLVIFVRGDWCPGCHMMLRTYEKNRERFQKKNIMVLAIGPDPVDVNKEMMNKLGLEFRVLADEGQRTAMTYGVQLSEYDNDFADSYEEGIPLPASFLIDINGIVRYVSRPDKVGEFLNPSMIFPIVEQIDSGIKFEKENRPRNAMIEEQFSGFEHVFKQANDAILVIDIVDGVIYECNPSASELLGYNMNDLKKLTLFDLHPKEYLEQSSRIVADVWEQGGMIYSDIPFQKKSGELVPVECSAKVAPFEGRPAIVIYARDISERLLMEAEINEQRQIIDERNKDIQDSIEYSKRIQRSILLEQSQLKTNAPDSFIFFEPKDIVSGDFYWFTSTTVGKHAADHSGHKEGADILFVAAVDCTGHGVPGAFMSIIGNSLLNQTLKNLDVSKASDALDFVNSELKKSLNKNTNETPLKDGMDMALCTIDFEGLYAEYSGANNPMYLVRNKELMQFDADKQPISASFEIESRPFSNTGIQLQKGDCLYLFTDGFADQFGGEHLPGGRPGGKKFLYKRFKELLIEISDQPMTEQKKMLKEAFESWRGPLEQVDDVLVIGIRV